MKTAIISTLAVVIMAGCGRAGSEPPETPAPDDGVKAEPMAQSMGAVTYIPTASDARVSRLGDLLMGRVPGLEVRRLGNGRYTLRIRGPRTLRGSVADEEPLLVLDGTPVPQGSLSSVLSAVPPRDVARVDVLRDAASTSIYGLRGANGVVVITTKRPR